MNGISCIIMTHTFVFILILIWLCILGFSCFLITVNQKPTYTTLLCFFLLLRIKHALTQNLCVFTILYFAMQSYIIAVFFFYTYVFETLWIKETRIVWNTKMHNGSRPPRCVVFGVLTCKKIDFINAYLKLWAIQRKNV